MKLAMQDETTLPFDSIVLKDGFLVGTRIGFKGNAIGVLIGGHLFPFKEPCGFGIPDSVSGFARLISQGDEHDRFIVHFNLDKGIM